MKIGIAGLGFVGGSAYKSFTLKGVDVVRYDKFKDGGIGTYEDLLKTDICFLCLPTLFNEEINEYDKSAINEICEKLNNDKYEGLVVVKSTVEPETVNKLSRKYLNLKICHNPEFLTARTAYEDFHNQTHIVLGKGINSMDKDMDILEGFYKEYYPSAEISRCSSTESESMKIMCNSFYASKITLFNEYYLLCQKNNSDFNTIKNLMLKNKWINSMHTTIPGPDNNLGYGGACFPKDTKALYNYMKSYDTPNKVLESVIETNKNIRLNP